MFNYANRSSLSEFADRGDIVRDAEFFGVGKIPSRVPMRLVTVINRRALAELMAHQADIAAVIAPPDLVDDVPDGLGCMVANDPAQRGHIIHSALASRDGYYWTDFPSRIAASAKISERAFVAERNVIIGEGVEIEPGVIIGERVSLDAGTYVGAGTVIGSRAFELVRTDGRNVLQTHVGGVRVGRDAIFLSGVMVARSIFATFTEIGENAAFDNLVHIAHDCVIGPGSQVTAGAVLAGRVTMEAESFVGPNATVSNGITIGQSAAVTIGATVIRDVEAGTKVSGNFAIDHRKFIKNFRDQSQ